VDGNERFRDFRKKKLLGAKTTFGNRFAFIPKPGKIDATR
jgi:hypothetical protein